ncbi:unnamed protein product [Rhizoctonia solani]|uniref:ERCC4 domain-containing protein n=1 Tax=Rhizoctonia solani TaxID=456999 RepID=A0A8H3GL75_9AGAM|nr:unnamed protein product [Rhizoctonia solani]
MSWNNESSEIIDISDSDSELGKLQPSLHTQSSGQGQPSSRQCEPSDILVIDSTDSEDLDELEAKLRRVYFSKKSGAAIPRPRFGASDVACTRVQSEDDVLVLSSSEEDAVVVQPVIQHCTPNSNNTPELKSGAAIQLRKQKDRIVGQNLQPSKASKKEQIKEQAKLRRDINKLVTDKKSTLKDFTVELSRGLEGYSFVDYLETKLAVHGCALSFFDSQLQSEHLIRFRRQHFARYDNKSKEWVPVVPYTALEDLYVLFLSSEALALAILEETLTKTLYTLRSMCHLTTRSQIFIMVDGLNGYYKRKGSHNNKRNTIESALASLQALERCFIVHVEGAEDTAQWLFNITGDLGIRPHKRIRESFLPFCTDTQVKCGSSKSDTYKKMLQQIRNITQSAADGIIEEVPTLRELFEGYAQELDLCSRYDRLKGVTVSNRKDGAAKSRILNQALSRKVHDVIWGEDPLILV